MRNTSYTTELKDTEGKIGAIRPELIYALVAAVLDTMALVTSQLQQCIIAVLLLTSTLDG